MAGYPLIIEAEGGTLLAGGSVAAGGAVVLSGANLPEEELREVVELRYTRIDYPGKSEPTIQVLGDVTKPLVFKGLLCDSGTGRPGLADAIRARVTAALRDAQPVRVTYRGRQWKGVLARAEWGERRADECAYEIEVEVIKGNRSGGARSAGTRPAGLRGVEAALARLREAFLGLPGEMRLPLPGTDESLYATPEMIPPRDFESDPWLRFRINAGRVLASAGTVAAIVAAGEQVARGGELSAALASASSLAVLLMLEADRWSPGNASLQDALGAVASVAACMAALDALRGALRE